MTPRQKHQLAWLALAGLAITVLVEATFPGSNEPQIFPNADKLIHFTVYGTIAYLVGYAFTASGRIPRPGVILSTILLVTLLGIITEFIQSYTPYRATSLADVLADTLGAMAFLAILYYQRKRMNRQD